MLKEIDARASVQGNTVNKKILYTNYKREAYRDGIKGKGYKIEMGSHTIFTL